MSKLYLDFETRSALDVRTVGTDIYAHDPSTEVLMLAYAFDDGPVSLWEPHLESCPPYEVWQAMQDPAVQKYAANAGFEYAIFSAIYKFKLQHNQWMDPLSHARYLGFPGNLDALGTVLKVDVEHLKDKAGKKYIKLFSTMTKAKKATKKKEAVPAHFKDWSTHPEDWAGFRAYCMRDVETERASGKVMDSFKPFPVAEYNIWVKDQVINERGIPIDLDFVDKALERVEVARKQILSEMAEITGCENPNSPGQLKTWMESIGYRCSCLDKEVVAETLKAIDLDPKLRAVLELKQELGGIAFKKLPVMRDRTREDRLRGAFVYHSAHTGRWASRGVQFHNLLRPTKRVGENYDAIVAAIKTGGIIPADIPTVEAVSGCMRAAVHASPGHKLYVADFSSIENRVLAWLAQCPGMLGVFQNGLDPYKSFAADFYQIAYDIVTKEQRNFCKSPVLGCGFGMGHKRLVDYAANMGQVITEAQAKALVDAWRKAFPEVVEYWTAVGDAAMQAVKYRQYLQLGPLKFDGRNPNMFFIVLPNGRTLNYARPFIGRDAYDRRVFKYYGMNKIWTVVEARGSALVENIVQATARDLLVNGMRHVENAGFTVVLHVHDELAAEVPVASPLTYAQFEHLMVTPPNWALDLPVKAEGYEGQIYRK